VYASPNSDNLWHVGIRASRSELHSRAAATAPTWDVEKQVHFAFHHSSLSDFPDNGYTRSKERIYCRRTTRYLLDTCGDEAYDACVYAIEALDSKTRTH
jgi:hypothetical protein